MPSPGMRARGPGFAARQTPAMPVRLLARSTKSRQQRPRPPISSAWRHAQSAVEPDHFAIEVAILDAVHHQRGELARLPEPVNGRSPRNTRARARGSETVAARLGLASGVAGLGR